jgi:glycerophosphoryl diester phosphodiesterase
VIDLGRRDGRLLRIGHRGAAALAPENSLEAIALAVELGCDLVEFDVHALGGALVVVHDRPQAAHDLPSLDDVLEFLRGTQPTFTSTSRRGEPSLRSRPRCGATASSTAPS